MASITEMDSIILDTIHFPEVSFGVFTSGGDVVSDFYGNSGVYCAWVMNGKFVGKVVCSSDSTNLITKSIASFAGGNFPSNRGMLDFQNRMYGLSDFKLFVLKDSLAGDPYSQIKVDTVVDLSILQNGDELRGIKMLYSGEIVLTTTSGTIIVLDRNTREVLFYTSLNETIQNNMAVDEGGNLFLNTNVSLYKFHWTGDSLDEQWRVPIGNSGTTPTLIGTTTMPDSSQLVAVVDKTIPMNLILVWKNNIPTGWTAIPGWPLRVAAVQPILFNTPFYAMLITPTENSLMVENNSILLARWTSLFPSDDSYKPGLEKWTWRPETKSLSQDWVNTTTFFPNATQCLSIPTGYFYSIGEKYIGATKFWTFEAIDWATGVMKVQKILGPHSDAALNICASGIAIGPYGDVLTMSRQMVFRFRMEEVEILTSLDAAAAINTECMVSPNPFTGSTQISFNKSYHSIAIDVYNIEGKLLSRYHYEDKDKVILDASQLHTGMYFLKITLDETRVETRKIIVKE